MLIDFKTAQSAKEKGFNLPTDARFYREPFKLNDKDEWKTSKVGAVKCRNTDDSISRPTQSELHKWLNDNHNIFVFVNISNGNNFSVKVYKRIIDNTIVDEEYHKNGKWLELKLQELYSEDVFISFEDAQEKGLKEALNTIL